jgi:alanine-glyoxylate transaminase/serine-glyoxylate transaminase/serine-pyruvate transaminase
MERQLQEPCNLLKALVHYVTSIESSNSSNMISFDFAQMLCRYNCLLVVDAVGSLGAVPLFTEKWEIDVLYSGSQKALSAPPGTSPISFSARAWEKVENRKSTVRSFYLDAVLLAQYWDIVQPYKYHHTGFPTNCYGLREGLAEIAEEGLEAVWKRHRENSELLWKGLEDMGIELFVSDKKYRLPTVTLVKLPDGIDWQKIIRYVLEKYSLEIAPGLGPSSGRVWRIGLMGYNSKKCNVELVLKALKNAMENVPRLNSD